MEGELRKKLFSEKKSLKQKVRYVIMKIYDSIMYKVSDVEVVP